MVRHETGAVRLGKGNRLVKAIKKDWELYLLLLLPLLYFLIFKYKPMQGLIIAFKDYKFKLGYWGSPWAKNNGFKHFIRFFENAYFKEILWNTLSVSGLQLIIASPMPIMLAIIMNEIRNNKFKKTLQTVTYAPHFISTVISVAVFQAMCSPTTGSLNHIIKMFGGEPIYFFGEPNWFRPLYVILDVWKHTGYNSIIYLAVLANIDQQLVEASRVDGANRLQIIKHITLPAMIPTAVTLLIMNVGNVMSIGYEKAFLMQNDMNIRTSEIISTYVYRTGIENLQYSYSTAVGLFNAVINIILLLVVNQISKKLTETSLW